MMNAGATKLVGLDLTCAEVVERLKSAGFTTSRMSVSHWQTGKKRPGPDARAALERSLGIVGDSWDLVTSAEPPAPPALAAAASPPPSAFSDPTAAELARDLLTRIQLYREQSEMTTLGMQARKALADMEGKAIERYARLSGQSATEREILSSPHFTRVLDEMFRVLEKHPEALRALRAAMTDAEAA